MGEKREYCKTWSGFVKGGFVKHGFVKGRFIKHGFVKGGFVKHGFVKHGFVQGGFVKHDNLKLKRGSFNLNLWKILTLLFLLLLCHLISLVFSVTPFKIDQKRNQNLLAACTTSSHYIVG